MRRHWMDPVVASNYPLLVLGYLFRDVHGATLASSAVASLFYHRSAETEFLLVDRTLAAAAFLSSLIIILRTVSWKSTIAVALAADILLAFLALKLSNRRRRTGQQKTLDSPNYNRWHTIWHVLIVAGQLLLLYHSNNSSV